VFLTEFNATFETNGEIMLHGHSSKTVDYYRIIGNHQMYEDLDLGVTYREMEWAQP